MAPRTELRRQDLSVWPRYDAAELGFRNYWYPVTWSRRIGRKPAAFRMLGDPVMIMREQGRLVAFYDQCPHRGIPLSVGRREFPGTWSCRYHGWTFDTSTGVLQGALTDGPDSPICGKVRVRTYPVQDRAGLVWIYMGEGSPPPLEEDVPEAFLDPNAVIMGRITTRKGNWRYGAENGFDEAHAKYLHRYGILWTKTRRMPGWSVTRIESDGPWIVRVNEKAGFESDYPGLGRWPRYRPWQRNGRPAHLSIRLPGFLRSQYATHAHYEWYVPQDRDHYTYLQFLVTSARGWKALAYRLRYWIYRRWLFHVQFNDQDAWMVELMPETPPERLFRPDVSITAWRRLCEHARGEPPAEASLEQQLQAANAEAAAAT